MIRKAVILARGLGKRMRAENHSAVLSEKQKTIAEQGIKALVPLNGEKTLLDFILQNLCKAGYSEFCLVIGEEHQAIRNYCRNFHLNITFAIQKEAIGTANAVLAAESFAQDDNFLVVNSDNLYPVEDLSRLGQIEFPGFLAYNKTGLIEKSNIDEEKINKFAILKIDQNGLLEKIIEKPEIVEDQCFISMNAWVFSSKIFAACREIKLSPRGEYELADAVNLSIAEMQEKYQAVHSDKGVLDLSSRADIAELKEKLRADE